MASQSLSNIPAQGLRSRTAPTDPTGGHGAQNHGAFNHYSVFKVEPFDDLNTTFRDGAIGMAPGNLSSDSTNILQPEAANTIAMANGVHREHESRQQETAQRQVDDTGALVGLKSSTPSLVPFAPAEGIQQPIFNTMGHGTSSYPGNNSNTSFVHQNQMFGQGHLILGSTTSGVSASDNFSSHANGSHGFGAHTPLNTNAPIEPCASANALDTKAELKCLREENQFMRQFICMLLARERSLPLPSL